jgi:hypothetical protein
LGKADHQGDNKRRRHATHPRVRISKPAFVLRRQSSRRRGWPLATHGRYGRGRRQFLERTFQMPLYCYDRCGQRSDTEVKEVGSKERPWPRKSHFLLATFPGGRPPTSIVQHHSAAVRLGSRAVKLLVSICSPNCPR